MSAPATPRRFAPTFTTQTAHTRWYLSNHPDVVCCRLRRFGHHGRRVRTCNAVTFAAAHGASGTTRNGAVGVGGLVFSRGLFVSIVVLYVFSLLEYKLIGAQDKLCPLLVDCQTWDTNCAGPVWRWFSLNLNRTRRTRSLTGGGPVRGSEVSEPEPDLPNAFSPVRSEVHQIWGTGPKVRFGVRKFSWKNWTKPDFGITISAALHIPCVIYFPKCNM